MQIDTGLLTRGRLGRRCFPSWRVFLIPLVTLALASLGHAQTNIGGAIYDGNGGPLLSGTVYHATITLTVPPGQTLTVQHVVIVK